jgi:hypothetical protein
MSKGHSADLLKVGEKTAQDCRFCGEVGVGLDHTPKVTPAQAGVQEHRNCLFCITVFMDSRLRGNDGDD